MSGEWRAAMSAPEVCPHGLTEDSLPGMYLQRQVAVGSQEGFDNNQNEDNALQIAGPGTELKKLLARVGITAAPDCACNARAAEKDRRERDTPGWCEANIDTIVGWLREQAETRGLPFLDIAGRMLVRRAISNARRNA